MNIPDWIYPVAYFAIGIPLGIFTGKSLSGKSEEARGWTFFMMVFWFPVLGIMLLLGLMAAMGKLADWLGIENAQGDTHGV